MSTKTSRTARPIIGI